MKIFNLNSSPLVRFMINYQFLCKNCNATDSEAFTKKQACKLWSLVKKILKNSWRIFIYYVAFHQLCTTALANLTAEFKHNDENQLFFSKDKVPVKFTKYQTSTELQIYSNSRTLFRLLKKTGKQ